MWFIIACAAAAHLVSAAVDIKSVEHRQTGNAVPNLYLVEFSEGSHLKRGFSSPHEELYYDLARRGANWEITKKYSDNSLAFNGAIVKLGSKGDLPKLAEANGVQSITPVYMHPRPSPVYQQAMKGSPDGAAPNYQDTYSTHVMTGVDKLHKEGYFGKGITIGIIDTGIDYTHPFLGGKFGPGNKVVGGYDFVGDAYTGGAESQPVPDNDPLDQCEGHGTHVAGIIGANPNNPWNISGVAYESEINAYRVFGCTGGVSDDIIIDALLRALKDGNDIITLSLGGPSGWTESASAVIASRIADKGRIVTVAAGNDGQYGSWYASGPATGRSVISVGSIDNIVLNIQNAIVSNGRKIPYLSLTSLDISAGLPIYATSQDPTVVDDACNPLPSNTPDLSNSLVLIRRGTCAFVSKFDNAAKFGAKNFLVYDNTDRPLASIAVGNYTATLIAQSDGIFLLYEGVPNNYTVSFLNDPAIISNPTGGLVSSFSTYGPTFDMYPKPAFAAPGGSILSTLPVPLGSWGILSGTSMATPFVAGSAALLLQVRGKSAETFKAARSLFQSTAIPVKQTSANDSLLETASHQGAGLLNVYDAIKNTGSLHPTELLLNDTASFNGVHKIVVKNSGKQPVTYTFAHVPAGTANTINGIEAIPGPVPLTNNAASVSIDPSTIIVQPGSSLPVLVTIKPPTAVDAKAFPIYSGYITATGSDNSTLRSTYMGLAAEIKSAQIIDNTDRYFGVQLPLIVDKDGNPVPSGGSAVYTMNGTDVPLVIYRLVFGTPRLSLDLIDSKTNVTSNAPRSLDAPTKLTKRSNLIPDLGSKLELSVLGWLFPNKCKACNGGIETLGALSYQDYLPRNTIAPTPQDGGYSTIQISTFANGTQIPDGSYKILLRALKIGGMGQNNEDETWVSPEITVKRT
ncbi:Minor extracellular protease vpr [Rhizoctonia solani AG-1 IB]|uniref:Minor extracellular protease vpr n=1 Tax=Thanatephorus cucumeris (strain AG1-IB / isolate 7/3/14) TaxID=1108050 RepID=M5C9C7_THACB|nr:Minor extracellular protease vpr [Rhizoctonia solani AG-1 IB]